MLTLPKRNDLYYHFKHKTENPTSDPFYMLYRIDGIGVMATDNEYAQHVIYSSVNDSNIVKKEYNADFFIRPLAEFLENVNRDGYNGPRFVKFTNQLKNSK